MAEEDTGEEAATKLSYAQSAIAEGVENEKCVVSQYRTSKKQKENIKRRKREITTILFLRCWVRIES